MCSFCVRKFISGGQVKKQVVSVFDQNFDIFWDFWSFSIVINCWRSLEDLEFTKMCIWEELFHDTQCYYLKASRPFYNRIADSIRRSWGSLRFKYSYFQSGFSLLFSKNQAIKRPAASIIIIVLSSSQSAILHSYIYELKRNFSKL